MRASIPRSLLLATRRQGCGLGGLRGPIDPRPLASKTAVRSAHNCPYRILGLQPGASHAQIKQQYLRLAKQLHPDVSQGRMRGRDDGPGERSTDESKNEGNLPGERAGRRTDTPRGASHGSSIDMARLNAAYEQLTDPRRREAATMSAEHRKEATAAAAALATAGRTREALAAFFSCVDNPAFKGDSDSAKFAQDEKRRRITARDIFLAACYPGRSSLNGSPTYAELSKMWHWLREGDLVDAEVCNGWFRACIVAGQTHAAMDAYRHAESNGLEQGSQMRSYVRQIRSYKASRAANQA